MKRALLAGLAFLAAQATPAQQQTAHAQQMTSPHISLAQVDWDAAAARLPGSPAGPAAAAFARLNAASGPRFPGIAASPVPVLLPFDSEGFATALAVSADETPAMKRALADAFMQAGFHASNFFFAGPAGYDAAFTLNADDLPALDIAYSRPIRVMFSGLAMIYHLGGPPLPQGEFVEDMQAEFPGLRRYLLESHVRYRFRRYGVTYVAEILCRDRAASSRYLNCRQADRIVRRFLRALKLAGGSPARPRHTVHAVAIERPQKVAPAFTYYGPGDLIPGTGPNRSGRGRADYTVYARLRFPIKGAPDFANSQSFNSWGNCDFTGRTARATRKDAPYSCTVNHIPLIFNEAAPCNYSYPWRDNFCEHRHYYVGQCPGGHGHQGQDIRPSYCEMYNTGSDRCLPYHHDVVAVHDGMIMRWRKNEAVYLYINTPNTHVRVRYIHMNSHRLDAAGILSGKRVREGEVIGKVANFNRHEHGTTYHLHFDMQVPTRIGWLFVNPYITLVLAYEHLIGARGTEIKPGDPVPPVAGVTPVIEHGHYAPPVMRPPPASKYIAVDNGVAGLPRVVALPEPRPDKIDGVALPPTKPENVGQQAPQKAKPHRKVKPHRKTKESHKSAKRKK
ncbi:MAG: M23 family metallopeptidase [Pseudolabrys sp.]